ncbi:MAG: hypothetical protein CVU38_04805 [Chloroflexi bacterium HGW-Chloroflexi-1]|nr:MAG: hypothetical protein CVU38_04805 [Chloroflexi bacterium HGW-Chloroflexi-1]
MQRNYIIVVCLVLVLGLALTSGGLAQEEGDTWRPPALTSLEPAPWRLDHGAWAAGVTDEEVEFVEVPVTADTFIASTYPYDWKSFEKEDSLWFGTDWDLGHLRTLLRWDPLPSLPGIYAGAAVYLPIAGQDPEMSMATRAYQVEGSWSAPKWQTQPRVWETPIAQFTIGTELGWYWFDISDLASKWHGDWAGGYVIPNYGIELRGPETSGRAVKGMWSREAGPDAPIATLVVAYVPDRTPPVCRVEPLPLVSSNIIVVQYSCTDSLSPVVASKLQMRQDDGAWQTVSSGGFFDSNYVMTDGRGGKTYAFRAQATDRFGNVSDWTPDGAAVTTVESVSPEGVARPASALRVGAGIHFPDELFSWNDPGPVKSGMGRIDRSYADASDGVWHSIKEGQLLPLEIGHHYLFRQRGIDSAKNMSSWIATGPALAYYRYAEGRVLAMNEQPLAELVLRIEPAALAPVVTDASGVYTAYLRSISGHTLGTSLASYDLENPYLPETAEDIGPQDHHVRSSSEGVRNGSFEAPLADEWQLEGDMVGRSQSALTESNHVLRFGADEQFVTLSRDGTTFSCLAIGQDGSMHLAWTEGSTLVYQSRDQLSTDWSYIEKPDSVTISRQYFGKCILAADADRRVHLAFTDDWTSGVYRIRDLDGNWSEPQLEPALGHSKQIVHSLVLDSSGTAHIILEELAAIMQDDGKYTIAHKLYYVQRKASGNWEAPVILASFQVPDQWSSYALSGVHADLALGADGTRHVVFAGDDSVGLAYRSSLDGRHWSTPEMVSAAGRSPTLELSRDGDLYAFWISGNSPYGGRFVYAKQSQSAWEEPSVPDVTNYLASTLFYSIVQDEKGVWRLFLQPRAGHEYLFSGLTLDTLKEIMAIPAVNIPGAFLVDDRSAMLYLLRHYEPDPSYFPGHRTDLVRLSASYVSGESQASQQIFVPAAVSVPMLSWHGGVGEIAAFTEGGQLYVGTTSATGEWHDLAPVSRDVGAHVAWVDLSAWSGQAMTLTYRFDQRGDSSAWAWLDDVHVGGVPLNAGVTLNRAGQLAQAGQDFSFAVSVSNRRPMSLTIPLEVTWPAGWPLQETSEMPDEARDGVARFGLPLDGETSTTLRFTVIIPTDTPRSAQTIAARLLDPMAAEDYTPDDNQAAMTLVVDGLAYWLPLSLR